MFKRVEKLSVKLFGVFMNTAPFAATSDLLPLPINWWTYDFENAVWLEMKTMTLASFAIFKFVPLPNLWGSITIPLLA